MEDMKTACASFLSLATGCVIEGVFLIIKELRELNGPEKL